MPLQNRVDPFGAIHAVPERGMFTGNRGIIHDPETKTLLKKRWTLQAWIICVCEYKGRRREPMGRNRPGGVEGKGLPGWTELFFLDEVTALAAGHRPCFFCRHGRASDFVGRFGRAFGIAAPRAPLLDRRLHQERFASSRKALPSITIDAVGALPDGAMVAAGTPTASRDMQASGVHIANDARAYAVHDGQLLPWSFAGYGARLPAAAFAGRPLALITPPTTVAVLAAGYKPAWHRTATVP